MINSFGGAYEKTHRELVIEPFEKMHNVKINVVTAYSADALAQLRAQKAAPQFDVLHFSGGQEAIAAKEGLLTPIKPDRAVQRRAISIPSRLQDLARGEGPADSVGDHRAALRRRQGEARADELEGRRSIRPSRATWCSPTSPTATGCWRC